MWWVPIVVALIGGPVMWFLARFDRRNTDQHNRNMEVLERIEQKVDAARDDLSDHFKWHAQSEGRDESTN